MNAFKTSDPVALRTSRRDFCLPTRNAPAPADGFQRGEFAWAPSLECTDIQHHPKERAMLSARA